MPSGARPNNNYNNKIPLLPNQLVFLHVYFTIQIWIMSYVIMALEFVTEQVGRITRNI